MVTATQETVMSNAFVPSTYQQDLFDFVSDGEGNGIVNAVAGSGKTTSLVQAAKLIAGKEAVFFAFNKHIAEEINARLGKGSSMKAMTIHAYGFAALRRAYSGLGRIDDRKYRKLAEDWVMDNLEPSLAGNAWQPEVREIIRDRVSALSKLCDMARLTLVDAMDFEGLANLMWRFDIATETDESDRLIRSGVQPVLNRGLRDLDRKKSFDFTDMIWVPVLQNLPVDQFDRTFVDECQDLNTTQRRLVMRSVREGGRLLAVGDEKQAIMGFAGADAASYWAIKEETAAKELPLSICYRCPSSHLDLARKIVPHIEDRPDAPDGIVAYGREAEMVAKIEGLVANAGNPKDGPLILCRTTAPLVSLCIRLIRKRLPAKVRGRDVAKGLTDIVKKVAKVSEDNDRFLEILGQYEDGMRERMSRADNAEALITALADKCEAIRACFIEFKTETPADLCREIEAIFDDGRAAIWLSTVHRAKGLEANDVFIIEPGQLPMRYKKQSAEQFQQELNLTYVALTRAKKSLTFVYPDNEALPTSNDELVNLSKKKKEEKK